MSSIGGVRQNPATMMSEPPVFLSRRQVARLFGVSVSTVTRWAQKGLLKTVRTPGGHYRFPADETRRAAGMARTGEFTETNE
ncbi:MAG: MerR family DNA-binding transcriptional regulator [Thermoanaerobaculia bacterium]